MTLQKEQGYAILMDADCQFGDVMVHLNARSPRTVSDLVHENGLEVDLLPEILIPHNSGLKLLLGPPKPEWAEKIIPGMVSEIINSLKNQFKVVIIDTESQLTNQTQAVFDSADYILAVAVPELPAIKDVKLFLEMTEQRDIDPKKLGVIINRANELGGIPPKKVEEVLNIEHAHLIPYDHRMDTALRKGQPVCQQDATAPSAMAIVHMAQQVWQELNRVEAAPTE